MQANRIPLLDSFRAIAILMVIFFHFFSRWCSLYPYENQYDFFRYGKFGVQFFFMISGFVIFFTLENTNSFKSFVINRIVRLLPSMFFASLITYFFFTFFDDEMTFPTSHYFKNVLVSLTFIQPDLIASISKYKGSLDYVSGSYWSLWVEIQFYFFAACIYFFKSKKFYTIFFVTASCLVVSNYLLSHIYTDSYFISKLKALRSIFNLIDALPYFCLGAIFYIYFKNHKNKIQTPSMIKYYGLFFIGFLCYNTRQNITLMLLFFSFMILFVCLIYFPKILSFLNHQILINIGTASYFLYLIHENIGVFLVSKTRLNIGFFRFVPPIVIALLLILLSILFTKIIEKRVILFLKNILKKTM